MVYGKELFEIILKNKMKIFIIIFCFTISSFLISEFLVQKKFTSTVDIISTISEGENNTEDASFNLTMIKTYKDLVKTDIILSESAIQMKKKYNKNLTMNEIKNGIEITQSNESQMFTIQVTSKNAKLSMNLANIIAEVLSEKIPEVLQLDNRISILSYAKEEKQSFPNIKINTVVGIVLGIIGSTFYIIFKVMNNSLKVSKDYLVNEVTTSYLGKINVGSNKRVTSTKIERTFFGNKHVEYNISKDSKRRRMNRYNEKR
ncbi:YveK family protein [Enterococcus faecalis]|uniref:YveK family protein n=1 Tax=Enterococcus faecalis TaxID=1351 RepID=UPI0025B0DBA3|nr:Wzz/FepE/Etk N-terminal domain-containing protein [Enterococcus faecalis]MDN3185225.1 Wzz/FepE/Etk N-terminal domain-containing protein [Enterococcus faecalis]